MKLFHTGFNEIPAPNVHYGRRNADFGQGFYLTPDRAFSERWARVRPDRATYINSYELVTDGLEVKHLVRDAEWFDYIYSNRSGRRDYLDGYDVIIGPIANDTIYDTLGITTSGFLTREQAMELLLIGPEYTQVTLKTEAAAAQLRFLGSEVLTEEVVRGYRDIVRQEEAKYQELFAAKLNAMFPD